MAQQCASQMEICSSLSSIHDKAQQWPIKGKAFLMT